MHSQFPQVYPGREAVIAEPQVIARQVPGEKKLIYTQSEIYHAINIYSCVYLGLGGNQIIQ